jgi:hypothetical protein
MTRKFENIKKSLIHQEAEDTQAASRLISSIPR